MTEDEPLKFCSVLLNLVKDMHIRFADLLKLSVPRWVVQLFSANPADLKFVVQLRV